jgi:hypothetical protein
MTIEAFTPEGKSAFITTWKAFEYPRTWHKLPNPISHINSFMMSDCLRLAMVFPFILNRFLKHQHLKQSELTKLQLRMNVSHNDLATSLWVRCWSGFSKSNDGFMNLSHHLKRLMSDWFIAKDKVNIRNDVDDANEGMIFYSLRNKDYSTNTMLYDVDDANEGMDILFFTK